ncbi:hypothetical protein TNCV_4282911 [Trichonephila clavipes]|nr:hypothetical protein TNCV_4282911 [Trichonephila clavipes]
MDHYYSHPSNMLKNDLDKEGTSEKIKFIVSEEDDEFTEAIETTSYGLGDSKCLDVSKNFKKQPMHMR